MIKMAENKDPCVFDIHLKIDGIQYVVAVTADIVEALNSDDTLCKHHAYEMIYNSLDLPKALVTQKISSPEEAVSGLEKTNLVLPNNSPAEVSTIHQCNLLCAVSQIKGKNKCSRPWIYHTGRDIYQILDDFFVRDYIRFKGFKEKAVSGTNRKLVFTTSNGCEEKAVSVTKTKTKSNGPEEQQTSWDKPAENMLGELFQDMEQSKKPMKNKWKTIHEKMQDKGYCYTQEQCRLKVKSLKDRHVRNKTKSNKSGESPVHDPMESVLSDIFDKQPDVKPIYIIDTDKKVEEATASSSQTKRKVLCSTSNGPKEKKERTKRASGHLDEMKDFLSTNIQRAEEAAEKRHQDRMTCLNSLITVLKSSINKNE